MERRFRLTRSSEFKQVRHSGRSYAHSLIAMYVTENGHAQTRVGIIAGRKTGNAVQRNRAKRLLRVAMRGCLPRVIEGVDILLIVRSNLPGATLEQVQDALDSLLKKARLFIPSNDQ